LTIGEFCTAGERGRSSLLQGGSDVGLLERQVDWTSETLYEKAITYARRAHSEDIDSSLFAFWMTLALELLCRAGLAKIHPVLLADPTNEGNIQYAFGINPKTNPRSVQAKTVFARCSVFIAHFTDEMSAHCLIVADRRNSELHSGAAAFEGLANSSWLPASYEVFEVVLNHLGYSLSEFLGNEYASTAEEALKDRRNTIKKHVLDRVAAAKRLYDDLTGEQRVQRQDEGLIALKAWLKGNPLRKAYPCPACGLLAGITGESISRGPVRINDEEQTIQREVRVLPNALRCTFCHLKLDGFQEMLVAGRGDIYTVIEEEDPIGFFGIVPEEHVDIDELIREHFREGYMNE
jgi:hypothetical protein